MKLIIDTSVLMSSFITPFGKTATLLFNPQIEVEKYSAYYAIVEIFKHQAKIAKLSKLSQEELLTVVYSCIKQITFVNEDQISQTHWQEAKKLTETIDHQDIAFVALALQIPDALLWTGDKVLISGLKAQGFERVVLTHELFTLLNQ